VAKSYAVSTTPTCDLELFITEHEARISCILSSTASGGLPTEYCFVSCACWLMTMTTELATNTRSSTVPCVGSLQWDRCDVRMTEGACQFILMKSAKVGTRVQHSLSAHTLPGDAETISDFGEGGAYCRCDFLPRKCQCQSYHSEER
jgi:hypothetical protein